MFIEKYSNILYAINRVANVPSYIPRFFHIEQNDNMRLRSANRVGIEATLSPRDKFFKQLASLPVAMRKTH